MAETARRQWVWLHLQRSVCKGPASVRDVDGKWPGPLRGPRADRWNTETHGLADTALNGQDCSEYSHLRADTNNLSGRDDVYRSWETQSRGAHDNNLAGRATRPCK